jgi:hypothetical protein
MEWNNLHTKNASWYRQQNYNELEFKKIKIECGNNFRSELPLIDQKIVFSEQQQYYNYIIHDRYSIRSPGCSLASLKWFTKLLAASFIQKEQISWCCRKWILNDFCDAWSRSWHVVATFTIFAIFSRAHSLSGISNHDLSRKMRYCYICAQNDKTGDFHEMNLTFLESTLYSAIFWSSSRSVEDLLKSQGKVSVCLFSRNFTSLNLF